LTRPEGEFVGEHRVIRLRGLQGGLVAPAVFDLNAPARYVHWHFFQMSVANLIVIGLMIVVFILAIALPFPKRELEE
jgi:hypothetical protein